MFPLFFFQEGSKICIRLLCACVGRDVSCCGERCIVLWGEVYRVVGRVGLVLINPPNCQT